MIADHGDAGHVHEWQSISHGRDVRRERLDPLQWLLIASASPVDLKLALVLQDAGARHADVDGADIWTATCGVCAMMADDWAGWQRHLQIIIDGSRLLVHAHDRASLSAGARRWAARA